MLFTGEKKNQTYVITNLVPDSKEIMMELAHKLMQLGQISLDDHCGEAAAEFAALPSENFAGTVTPHRTGSASMQDAPSATGPTGPTLPQPPTPALLRPAQRSSEFVLHICNTQMLHLPRPVAVLPA